ncbi:ATP-binding protein [Lentzea flaviverrucosa]|uniref:Tetratricopeptide repeat-containing protein n=1 Tax=Lentzea flaviverrucosa TaxID=200379 RepID=A0A1H9CD91_9PSEU|nr:AAA family ATPase [Lentzea flaviverrucosa]RDI24518.1 tetratricopeptide repeat protein [Lentzea flaviverrucosa]SEP99200.1 Tetratricopeptide repeat-containing protein [Lentzea flaviverrucosa]
MTRLIGRDQEVARLTRLLEDAVTGKPVVVMVNGEAGVGKSRLLAEFADSARATGAVVLAGGCLELQSGAVPYGPLVQALRVLVRQHGEQEARRLAGPVWDELAALIAGVAGSSPASGTGLGAQHHVFLAVSRMFDHIGSLAPLVVVFEDVHWADTATLDLIAYLALTVSDQRLMLVCGYRSGLRLGHPLRTRLAQPDFTRHTHRMPLVPFTRGELRAFVAELTGGDVSPERADRYFELSEGNPYFTEQLVAADDPARPDPHVPESLTDLMHAQLAQLGPDAATVVRVAAVAGRQVSDDLLAQVAGVTDSALDSALTECLDRQVLVDVLGDSYRFRHALLRETAYGTVRLRERKRLHAALAEVLADEVVRDPHVLPELAYHWSAADRVPEALRAAIGAGDLAVRVRAFQDAEVQYRRALDLWARHPEAAPAAVNRVQVLKVAADAARWAGHLTQAVEWAEEAVAAASSESPQLLGELHERLGSYRWEAGFDAESLWSYRLAHELLRDEPPSALGSRVRSALATVEAKSGRYTEALAMAREAEREAEQANARAEVGRARNSAGLALTLLGDHTTGIATLRDAHRIAEETDHLEDLLRAAGNLGVCLERAGQDAEAVEVFRQALERSRQLGLMGSRQAGLLANNACAMLFLTGGWEEASRLIAEVLRYFPKRETTFQRLTKAEMDLATGRFAEAERLLESVRNHPSAQPKFLSPLYRCLAELAVSREEPDAALATVRHGIEAIAGTEEHLLRLQLCAFGLKVAADHSLDAGDLLGHASPPDGDTESAVLAAVCAAEADRAGNADTATAWHSITEAWRQLDRPYPMAYSLARLAGAAAREGDRELAARAAAEAAEVAGRLGAKPLAGTITSIQRAHHLLPRETRSTRNPFGLTARELEIVRELDAGLTNRQLGTQLHVTKATVGRHLSNVYQKLGVTNKTAALRKARDAGLLD